MQAVPATAASIPTGARDAALAEPLRPRRPIRSAGRAGDGIESARFMHGSDAFRVGVCAPMRGSAGIWGPSCLASARLAQAELNRWSGIAHRPCELQVIDASAESPEIEQQLLELVDGGAVHALVGMCISSVRERIAGVLGGRVPFVYPCLYEGGEYTPGVYAIGETSPRQLRPSIRWLSERRMARRWMLVGHDYVWPRVSHVIARQSIAECGGEVVAEATVDFGVDDYSQVLHQLRRTRADAILISMVGQDAIDFNRAFGREGLSRNVLRLSCAIEENQLLAIGAENTENLHVALGYFATLDTDANLSFTERYHSHFGERAPPLNSIGQSLYEGMHFLATLQDDGRKQVAGPHSANLGLAYPSARSAVYVGAGSGQPPIYLARADGHVFEVLARF